MKEITSATNQLVKETAKLHLKKYRKDLILIEGEKAVYEAIKENIKIEYIFTLKNDFKGFETYLVNQEIMKKISTTESPASVVAVAKKPNYEVEDFMKFNKIVLLDEIKDAGNLGTILRACSAFGVGGVFLFKDTVDEFSPKTIRSSTGNIFKTPVLKIDENQLKTFKKTHKFIATVVKSDKYLEDYKKDDKIIIMFGSEADGLCDDLLRLADEKLTIKMTKNVESLNLSLCAGIVLYEFQKS